VLNGASEPHAWARDQLREEQRETIAGWPLLLRLDVEGIGATLFCHATPRSDGEILTPKSTRARWTDALAGVGERTIVCGHTHLQFDLELAGRRVVNPGSVGAPTRHAAAWWAVLGPEVDLRVTEYDTDATIAAADAVVPDVRPFARWLLETPSDEERVRSLEDGA
jgi:diadenosine tetraphosphatase ApaH/serine/threonine PP2A family protein phosphatase